VLLLCFESTHYYLTSARCYDNILSGLNEPLSILRGSYFTMGAG